MAQYVDFPIFYIRADRVDSTKPSSYVYASCLSNTAVNGYFPDRRVAREILIDKLAANIESGYKSAVAYPSVYATGIANATVANGGLLFISASSGTAGEVPTVTAVTAATAILSAVADSTTLAVTITISDTAANNTANAVTAAVAASTAADTGAYNYISCILLNGVSHVVKPEDSRNTGVGLVAAFAAVSLLQSNTLQGSTVRDRILKASIGY